MHMDKPKVIWSPDAAEDRTLRELEVDKELPNTSYLRLYGSVTMQGIGYDPTCGGPTGYETTVAIHAASFWETAETAEASTVASLQELLTLTGLSLEAIGDVLLDHQHGLDEDAAEEQYLRRCEGR